MYGIVEVKQYKSLPYNCTRICIASWLRLSAELNELPSNISTMVQTVVLLKLDGSSEYDAYVLNETGNFTCSRHLLTTTAVKFKIHIHRIPVFFYTCATCPDQCEL